MGNAQLAPVLDRRAVMVEREPEAAANVFARERTRVGQLL
jgi:hypothetical protein